MKESKKDRIIRIGIIIFLLIVVVFAFQTRRGKLTENSSKVEENVPKAAIIHKSENVYDPSIIALYQWYENKHWLIIYQVDRTSKNHFQALFQKELKVSPKALQLDKKSNGIWVQLNNKWVYFNDKLKKEKRDTNYRNSENTSEYPFTMDREKRLVKLQINNETMRFPINQGEEIISIHSISKDNTLWLAVYKNDIKVLINDRKNR